jgi:pyridoxal 5'-phosphate synthase pdxT subunit
MRIGVLALQGDFAEHAAVLARIGSHGSEPVEGREVRTAEQLAAVDGLIIPGGESTTMGKLLHDFALLEPLRRRVAEGMPVFGTCAGAIALARHVDGLPRPLIGLMDITVRRNAYGRQLESFEADVPLPVLGDEPLRAIFIRAPSFTAVGEGVQVLAKLPDGSIVAARQNAMLAISFHPELTPDDRLHRYFIDMVLEAARSAAA